MFSKIQDLDRYKQDQKRFNLGIDSASGEAKEEGIRLLSELNKAIFAFDNVMNFLSSNDNGARTDHAVAQEVVLTTKTAMEIWMTNNAPSIHVEDC